MATKTFTKDGTTYSAVQYDGSNTRELVEFVKESGKFNIGGSLQENTPIALLAPNRPYRVLVNDWVFMEDEDNIFYVPNSDIGQYEEAL